jgi:hypothetical protein
VPTSRLLYIDESLSKRLAAMLKQRGRHATCASELGFIGLKDEPLLRQVYADRDDIVFVTADDDLPKEHGGVIKEVGATIATIAPYLRGNPWPSRQENLSEEESWKRETVHRWAHAMQDQERRTTRRYSPRAGVRWTPKQRRKA